MEVMKTTSREDMKIEVKIPEDIHQMKVIDLKRGTKTIGKEAPVEVSMEDIVRVCLVEDFTPMIGEIIKEMPCSFQYLFP